MFISTISQRVLRGWNEHVFTEPDVYAFCAKNNIYVISDRKQRHGRLVYYRGYTFLLMNPYLEYGMRMWVLLHEIGHFILHSTETRRFSSSMKRKNDAEANFVAAVALMPKPLVEGKSLAEIQEEYGWPTELIQIRKVIYDNEGI